LAVAAGDGAAELQEGQFGQQDRWGKPVVSQRSSTERGFLCRLHATRQREDQLCLFVPATLQWLAKHKKQSWARAAVAAATRTAPAVPTRVDMLLVKARVLQMRPSLRRAFLHAEIVALKKPMHFAVGDQRQRMRRMVALKEYRFLAAETDPAPGTMERDARTYFAHYGAHGTRAARLFCDVVRVLHISSLVATSAAQKQHVLAAGESMALWHKRFAAAQTGYWATACRNAWRQWQADRRRLGGH
jgi:hypothetical protein